MFAIVRGDLDMPAGKLSAQSGHAYTDSLVQAPPEVIADYRNLEKGGSKVSLVAKNLNQLIRAYEECLFNKLPCAIIVDQDHVLLPNFDGSPIITALGIGPCTKAECAHITKRFKCL
jgi:peptidyl-tRNA hydrolase